MEELIADFIGVWLIYYKKEGFTLNIQKQWRLWIISFL